MTGMRKRHSREVLETPRADSRTSTLMKAHKSLEVVGIEFINHSDGAAGILLRPGNKA